MTFQDSRSIHETIQCSFSLPLLEWFVCIDHAEAEDFYFFLSFLKLRNSHRGAIFLIFMLMPFSPWAALDVLKCMHCLVFHLLPSVLCDAWSECLLWCDRDQSFASCLLLGPEWQHHWDMRLLFFHNFSLLRHNQDLRCDYCEQWDWCDNLLSMSRT